jgi:hypothetical protein
MRALVVSLVGVMLLAGCATPVPPPTRYSKPGATQEQFMSDRYDCMLQAQREETTTYANQYNGSSRSGTVIKCGIWRACLGARGYTIDPNGNVGAPKEMAVTCSP